MKSSLIGRYKHCEHIKSMNYLVTFFSGWRRWRDQGRAKCWSPGHTLCKLEWHWILIFELYDGFSERIKRSKNNVRFCFAQFAMCYFHTIITQANFNDVSNIFNFGFWWIEVKPLKGKEVMTRPQRAAHTCFERTHLYFFCFAYYFTTILIGLWHAIFSPQHSVLHSF